MRKVSTQYAPNAWRLQITDRRRRDAAPPEQSRDELNVQGSQSYNHIDGIQLNDTLGFRDSVNSALKDPLLSIALSEAEVLAAGGSTVARLPHRDIAGHELTNSRRGQGELARDGFLSFWPLPSSKMDSVNLAVIGTEGAGKSSFIQKALRLSRPPVSNVSSNQQDIEGVAYWVTIIELDVESIDVDPNRPIQWPKQMDGHAISRVDGALILYDVMNKDSIRELPPIIYLPTVLVATKCDNPETLRQLDATAMAAAFPSCIRDFKTSVNVPGSTRDCLQFLVTACLINRGDKALGAGSRRRAASTAQLELPNDAQNGRMPSKHSRASSDLSLLRGFSPSPGEGAQRRPASRSPHLEHQRGNITGPDISGDGNTQNISGLLRAPGMRLDTHESFLDMSESDADSYRYSEDIPILQRNDDAYSDRPAKITGVTFDELVDRLLGPQLSKADYNFADVFLCLYRKFAAPSELFSAVKARLDQYKEDKQTHYLTKTAAQLRIIEIVAKWVATYPGDFARPGTRKKLDDLIRHLATEPVFSMAAQQMRMYLDQRVVEDDDTGWAKSDDADGVSNRSSTGTGKDSANRSSDVTGSMTSLTLAESHERRPSEGSELSGAEHRQDRVPARFQFHSVEDYEREAATLSPLALYPMNKHRWHMFMDYDADDIADEMTRIDWIMFSSIRVRDLVRSVSLSLEEKQKCRSLKNVNRMISHFNHIAKWVANMILIRDKPKHRAVCLEKFMIIAQKLRLLNNYNGLAAVLAGINGTAIHRLAQTRALVTPETQRKFARLGLLMGTQKSHFAYRLAWENSPLPRIPFMPLHRRDLVSAEEGSRTFVGPQGDRINWKKFEVLGEVLLPIMKSQGTPYPNLHMHELSRDLILGCRMSLDDEDIYQRSVQVEGAPSGALEAGKKKFPWLAK